MSGTSLEFDDRHASFIAGLDYGLAQRVEAEIEDQVHARLHERAREMLGFARRLAARKGPAWEAMIVWSGQADE